jgi:hypothetical protein
VDEAAALGRGWVPVETNEVDVVAHAAGRRSDRLRLAQRPDEGTVTLGQGKIVAVERVLRPHLAAEHAVAAIGARLPLEAGGVRPAWPGVHGDVEEPRLAQATVAHGALEALGAGGQEPARGRRQRTRAQLGERQVVIGLEH